MKKIIVALVLMLIVPVSYAKSFTCTGHFEGSPIGEKMKVNAAKAIVAETKGKSRLKKAGINVEYVRCKED